ncbi:hypothetical protein H7171_02200 [Candidatus Saccharibacteria bacterium]|nr:hypothetical protein [Candidatus Saccharibacteria bacterium]
MSDTRARTYFFAFEIGQIEDGHVYDAMPLHCTLMHRFHSALTIAELTAIVRPLFASTQAILLKPGERMALGPHRILVNKLVATAPLLQLHLQLYTLLTEHAVHFTESDWVGDGYIPHVSDQRDKRFNSDQPFLAKSVFLARVEFPLQGSRRFIEAKIPLSL